MCASRVWIEKKVMDTWGDHEVPKERGGKKRHGGKDGVKEKHRQVEKSGRH